MTTEEIIEQLDSIVDTYEILVGNGVNSDILDVDDIEALRAAIKLIKAIDAIQAEIDEQWYIVKRNSIECAEGLEMASEIIRKHTSGKEGE